MMSAMEARWSARGEVASLIGFGFVVTGVGVLVAYLTAPWNEAGAMPIFVLGALGVLAGQLLVVAGVIAVGVRLGRKP